MKKIVLALAVLAAVSCTKKEEMTTVTADPTTTEAVPQEGIVENTDSGLPPAAAIDPSANTGVAPSEVPEDNREQINVGTDQESAKALKKAAADNKKKTTTK